MNVDAERSINLYPEVVDSGTPKVKTWLVGTPGLRGYLNFGQNHGGPVRALYALNGRAFAVVGMVFYEFFANRKAIWRGDVAVDGNPASICSNGTAGNQIFIVSGGHGYIFRLDDNSYVELGTDPAIVNPNYLYTPNFPYPCAMGAFLDGYFIGLLAHSRQFRLSALEDGTSWDGLDVGEVSDAADDLRALAVTHRELWLFGEHSTHPWYNSGVASFPFQPISGVYIEHGILAPYSVVMLDNTLFWLGSDRLGTGIVWRANGYTPQRVSTHAVEYWLKQKGRLDRSIAYAYQDEGHSFYHLYVPDAETSWTYDVATGFWHERATWDPDELRWEPHLSRCHCYAFGRHLVGDRSSGQVYEMSLDLFDEDITPLNSTITVP